MAGGLFLTPGPLARSVSPVVRGRQELTGSEICEYLDGGHDGQEQGEYVNPNQADGDGHNVANQGASGQRATSQKGSPQHKNTEKRKAPEDPIDLTDLEDTFFFSRVNKEYKVERLVRDVCNDYAVRVRWLAKDLAPSDVELKAQLEEIAISVITKSSIKYLLARDEARWADVLKEAAEAIKAKHRKAERIWRGIPYPKEKGEVKKVWLDPSMVRFQRAKRIEIFRESLMGDCAEYLGQTPSQAKRVKGE